MVDLLRDEAGQRLLSFLKKQKRLAIAYSGGIDSRLLCSLAFLAGIDILALHARGPQVLAAETEEAQDFAQEIGFRTLTVDFSPLALEEVRCSSRYRCYVCKKALIGSLKAKLRDLQEESRLLCDGTNLDDLSLWRPGLRALKEEAVCSPLVESRCSKKDILRLMKLLGLPLPSFGSRPCLLTRFAYGQELTLASLQRVAQAESLLLALSKEIGDFRVRLCPSPILQVQHLPQILLQKVDLIMQKAGLFPYELHIGEKVTGFFDRS